MSLDVRFTVRRNVMCPHCGKVVMTTDEQTVDTGGRAWYPILEELGYYVPYELRTEENDWYGKDMVLNDEQLDILYQHIRYRVSELYHGMEVLSLIAVARMENDMVVLNADW